MTNNLVFPLLALVLALLAALFPSEQDDQSPGTVRERAHGIRVGAVLSAAAILVFTAATFVWPTTYPSGGSIAIALAIGALVGIFSVGAGDSRGGFAFGLAVFGAGLLHLLPEGAIGLSQVAYVTGAFIAAFTASGLWGTVNAGYLAVYISVFVVAADFLGRIKGGSDIASHAGIALGIAFLVAALVSGVCSRLSKSQLVRGGLGFVTLLIVGFLACSQYLGSSSLAQLWLGGVIVGGVVHLILLGEVQPSSFRFILATVIWLGAATAAFGMDLGYGMAVGLLGGVTTLTLFGNMRGLMTMGVAASILIYRLFRELYPGDAKALDIGQHYTMIGIAIGALIPLLPLEWARSIGESRPALVWWREVGVVKVWLILLLGMPVAAAVLLGSKGAIGMVVGLSFAALVEGLRGASSLASVGLATGLGCLTVLSYGWLGDWTDLDRGIKVRAVLIVAVAICILAVALWGVSRQKPTAKEA